MATSCTLCIRRKQKLFQKDRKESWGYNDCSEVSQKEAEMIAKQLRYLIKTGHTKRYSAQWEARRKTLEVHNEKVEKELSEFSESVKKKMKDDNLAPKDFPETDQKKFGIRYTTKEIAMPLTLFQ